MKKKVMSHAAFLVKKGTIVGIFFIGFVAIVLLPIGRFFNLLGTPNATSIVHADFSAVGVPTSGPGGGGPEGGDGGGGGDSGSCEGAGNGGCGDL